MVISNQFHALHALYSNSICAHINEVSMLCCHPSSGKAKTIFVVIPPTDKDDEAKTIQYTLEDDKAMQRIEWIHNGVLTSGDTAVINFRDVVDQGMYILSGAFYWAYRNGRTKAQIDSKLVEIECTQAVRACLVQNGVEDAHLHLNIKDHDDTRNCIFEIDGVVHSKQAGSPNATAYVVETAYSPQPRKIQQLLEKVEMLKKSAQSKSSHFHNCTSFVPVLGGRSWSEETTAMCKAYNPPIWRVKPSGASYQVHRTFSTSTIKIVTFILK